MTLEDISKALGIPLKVSNDSINEINLLINAMG